MNLLFIDPVCPKPLTIDDLKVGRMGGTEATLLRVAKALSARYIVTISQRGRKERLSQGITYVPLEDRLISNPDVVITLRDAKAYRKAINDYPEAKHYLWLHDVVSGDYQKHLKVCLSGYRVNIIVVSNWHKNQVMNALLSITFNPFVIYNPVAEYCTLLAHAALPVPYNPKKLIFTSSPHKGLDQVLEIFQLLRAKDPEFTLYVANPGYYEDAKNLPEGVIDLNLKHLSHAQLMEEVRSSLCLFYPQTLFEETFGIVYAEANAVGTPVLATNIGAASEVLELNHQLVPKKVEVILDTVQAWAKGSRPTVMGNKAFTTQEVIKTWNKLIRFGNIG